MIERSVQRTDMATLNTVTNTPVAMWYRNTTYENVLKSLLRDMYRIIAV